MGGGVNITWNDPHKYYPSLKKTSVTEFTLVIVPTHVK